MVHCGVGIFLKMILALRVLTNCKKCQYSFLNIFLKIAILENMIDFRK